MGQGHALVELGRGALITLFAEPAGAGKARQAPAVVPVQAELLAPLFAVSFLRRRQQRQRQTVGVEGFVGVELAIGRGRIQRQRRRQRPLHQTRHAPDLAVQTQALAAVEGGARRQGRALPRRTTAQNRARRRVGGIIGDGLERGAGGGVGLIVGDQVGAQIVGRGPGARQAEGLGLDAVVVLAAQQVLDRAVARLHPRGQAQSRRLADRGVHEALDRAIAEVAGLGPHLGVELARTGAVLHQIDRPDQGAATIEGRLRPLGDLDPLQIEQLDIGAARLGDRHPVLKHGNARLGRGRARVRGDAAHHKARIIRRLVLHQEARHEGRQLFELLNAQVLEELAAIGCQGEGHLDGVLRTQLGGDDDVVHRRDVVLGRALRLGRAARHQAQHRRARQQASLVRHGFRHHIPLEAMGGGVVGVSVGPATPTQIHSEADASIQRPLLRGQTIFISREWKARTSRAQTAPYSHSMVPGGLDVTS
ncbi:hypothetical protein D3C80_989060 [compost metagenome]